MRSLSIIQFVWKAPNRLLVAALLQPVLGLSLSLCHLLPLSWACCGFPQKVAQGNCKGCHRGPSFLQLGKTVPNQRSLRSLSVVHGRILSLVHKQEFTVAPRWVTKFVQFCLDLETFKLILVVYLCLHVGLLKWITGWVRHRHDRILEPHVRFYLSLLGWS